MTTAVKVYYMPENIRLILTKFFKEGMPLKEFEKQMAEAIAKNKKEAEEEEKNGKSTD